MKKKNDHSLLDAVFNIKKPPEESLIDILCGSKSTHKASAPTEERRSQSNKEECPNCGALFPVGGTCPGCGMQDEELYPR